MTQRTRRTNRASSVALRVLAFAALWWLLTGGAAYGWAVAAVSVGAAAGVSLALMPPGGRRWSVRGLGTFVPYFLQQSLLGGVDVARRALAPTLRLSPGFVEYPLRLPPGPARSFLLCAINLLPGTLSFQVRGDVACVHVLDRTAPVDARLRTLERKVAALFGDDVG
jgi:multicomponent Na+:H+ antiporter subunit E